MPQTRKIATCCYCGTRAVLVLDRGRHELACSACGAPLHEMKAMPVARTAPQKRAACIAAPVRPKPRPRRYSDDDNHYRGYRKEKRRKRKPVSRWVLEELWDVVEDIFD